jgi:peptidoglycan/LPS O-acetylase OafA/YrhL
MVNLSFSKTIFLLGLLINVFSRREDCINSLKEMTKGNYENTLLMVYYSGNDINDLGKYEDCESLPNTKYVLGIINLVRINIVLGICGPSACDAQDYKELFYMLPSSITDKAAELDIIETEFYSPDEYNNRPYSLGAIAFIVFSTFLVGIICVGTYLEVQSQELPQDNRKLSILTNFAITTNYKKLISFPEKSENLHVFNGLKVISMLLISLSHSYVYHANGPLPNPLKAVKIMKNFNHKIICSSIYVVDVFFVISGFLLAFLVSSELEKRKGKINWIIFILHRLMRIVPVYFFIYWFYISLFPYLGNGPAWPLQEYKNKVSCGEYWYSNFLFINNFVPSDQPSCMGWSWYVANDIQLYMLSPIILYTQYKNKAAGYLLCIVLIIVNTVIVAIQSFLYHYNPGTVYGLLSFNQFSHSYQRFYTRMGAFFIGMLFGLLYRNYFDLTTRFQSKTDFELGNINEHSLLTPEIKRKKVQNIEILIFDWVHSKKLRIFSSFLGVFLILFVVYIPYGFENNGPDSWTETQKIVFLSTEHNIFSIGLVLFLIPLINGYGGYIKDFLCSKYFTIGSRISFSYYLVHPIFIIFYATNTNQAIQLEDLYTIYHWFGTVLLSICAASLLTLSLESPVMSIEKIIFKKSL